MTLKLETNQPGEELYRYVKAGFILQGSTFGEWCKQNKFNPSNYRIALLGVWNGNKAQQMRDDAIRAAGLTVDEEQSVH